MVSGFEEQNTREFSNRDNESKYQNNKTCDDQMGEGENTWIFLTAFLVIC